MPFPTCVYLVLQNPPEILTHHYELSISFIERRYINSLCSDNSSPPNINFESIFGTQLLNCTCPLIQPSIMRFTSFFVATLPFLGSVFALPFGNPSSDAVVDARSKTLLMREINYVDVLSQLDNSIVSGPSQR